MRTFYAKYLEDKKMCCNFAGEFIVSDDKDIKHK